MMRIVLDKGGLGTSNAYCEHARNIARSRVYHVRDSEGLGWEGPRVTAWSDACREVEELLK